MTLLLYILIKSRLQRIFSNCKYTELFIDENKYGLEKSELLKVILACQKIESIKMEDFYNINESEYYNNCELALKGLLY